MKNSTWLGVMSFIALLGIFFSNSPADVAKLEAMWPIVLTGFFICRAVEELQGRTND